jgi:U3 small nucleolar RNA-associated protein 15
MYAPVLGQSPTIDSLFLRLRKKLEVEIQLQNDLVKVKGALDMLFAFASLSV